MLKGWVPLPGLKVEGNVWGAGRRFDAQDSDGRGVGLPWERAST